MYLSSYIYDHKADAAHFKMCLDDSRCSELGKGYIFIIGQKIFLSKPLGIFEIIRAR
jgi:hypothetical protein